MQKEENKGMCDYLNGSLSLLTILIYLFFFRRFLLFWIRLDCLVFHLCVCVCMCEFSLSSCEHITRMYYLLKEASLYWLPPLLRSFFFVLSYQSSSPALWGTNIGRLSITRLADWTTFSHVLFPFISRSKTFCRRIFPLASSAQVPPSS